MNWQQTLVMCAAQRLSKLILCLLLLVNISRLYMILSGADADIIFFYTPFRIDGLLLGAFAAVSGGQIYQKYKFLFLIVWLLASCYFLYIIWNHLSTVVHKNDEIFTLHRILIPLATNMVYFQLLVIALQPGLIAKVLSNAFLSFIAKYSYGIYVYHYLFYPIVERNIYPGLELWFGPGNISAFIFFVILMGLATSLAYLSYHLFEKQFLKLKDKL